MWMLATALALTVLLGLHGYLNGDHVSTFASVCLSSKTNLSQGLLLYLLENRLGDLTGMGCCCCSTRLGWFVALLHLVEKNSRSHQEFHGVALLGTTRSSHLLFVSCSLRGHAQVCYDSGESTALWEHSVHGKTRVEMKSWNLQYASYGIPIIVISTGVAFIWSCMFEIPSMKLEKMIFGKLLRPKSAVSECSAINSSGSANKWQSRKLDDW